jgi:hypothetical protein
MHKAEPTKEHEWLHQLVGDWAYEHEAAPGPDQPKQKFTGTERVRSVGGLWIVAEGQGEMPGGGVARTCLTLGYDPQKQRFVGTWYGSMMYNLWVYEGSLDETGKRLVLETEGPDFAAEGKTASYRETIELLTPDHRIFSSSVRGDDGTWTTFMTAHYRRSG